MVGSRAFLLSRQLASRNTAPAAAGDGEPGFFVREKAQYSHGLEEHLGWSGIGVDALPEMAVKWKRQRRASTFLNYIVTDHEGTKEPFFRVKLTDISAVVKPERGPGGDPMQSEEILVPTITLTTLLDQSGIGKVDFVSMDIEGSELPALRGFGIARFAPKLVCIEAKIKNREGILKYFSDHGYERLDRYLEHDQVNYYFAPRSAVAFTRSRRR
jgi:FkbM family methyltransferase